MASKQTWENWRSSNSNKGTDVQIQSMICDVVETIHSLERMYGNGAQLIIRGLLQEWHSLSDMARARDITFEHP